MTDKRIEGNPVVLDPARRIVDPHHHLFLRPGSRYLADDLGADMASGHNVVASVYMEAGGFPRKDGPEWLRSIGEVEFANGVAAMAAGGYFGGRLPCAGIVGHADLRMGDMLDRLLDRMEQTAPERFRGIRQLVIDHPSDEAFRRIQVRPARGLLRDNDFRDGLARLQKRGLSFDVGFFHVQAGDVADVADLFPDLTFVLNHLGMIFPTEPGGEHRKALRAEWARAIADLAQRPNIVCKVGGLGMPVYGFGFEQRAIKPDHLELAQAWRPYVETAIEAFTPARCMFESNFPIDAVSASYADVWNAFQFLARQYAEHEQEHLFSKTAERVYRLDLPGVGPDRHVL